MSNPLDKLEALLHQHPHIQYASPLSSGYAELREAYILGTEAKPLTIIRPQNAEDVALLVSYAVAERIPLTVRGGGHDLFGRCFATGAIAIDMRDIRSVHITADKKTATIGGGILATDLAGELGRHKLATAVGSAPTVGWVGWATHGGYGPFAANYGLGLDQILGATLVNSKGEIVEADELMLATIRGGGGSIGVIIDVTIKVYPLSKILGGVIVFKADDLGATLSKFTEGYQQLAVPDLPDALGIQQSFVNTPSGKMFTAVFVWSSDDLDLGYVWLDKIKSLGTVIHNSVVPTTIQAWLNDSGKFVPKTAYGGNCTVSVRSFTDEVVAVVAEHIAKMPTDSATLFSAHQLRGTSATPRADSVFGARTPHYVFEFIATSSTTEQTQASWAWATAFRDAVRQTRADNVCSFTYISLTPPSDANYASIYGPSWERLVKIKNQYDPDNVFRYSMPQFS
ncbi:hypothetical protein SEUCBS139899_008155 [Sporothrix eucalyptigena]